MLVEYIPPDGVAHDPLIGTLIEKKYRIEDKIAQGGMSTVYLASHIQLDLPVAVKVLHERLVPDETAISRFRREAQSAMQIRHTNAIAVMDFGVTESNLVYLVMEYLQGMTLREKLGLGKALSLRQIFSIMQQICAAVKVAHRRGIVHRDLKPENIFLQKDAEGEVVKVLDFGIAKLENLTNTLDLQLADSGNVFGSPHYMSPEQWSNEEVDVRSDVYSLGVILFEMLVGELPFTAPNMAALSYKHTIEQPPGVCSLRSDLPRGVEALVSRMLDKDPAMRPEDAGTLSEELEIAFASILTPSLLRTSSDKTLGQELEKPAPSTGPLSIGSNVLNTLSGTTEWPFIDVPADLTYLETRYSLDSIFLPEVFGLLARERVTGVAWFSSGLIVKGLFWQVGKISFVLSNDWSEQFGERLVRQGRMQRKQLNAAISWQNDHEGTSIVDALLALEYLKHDALGPLLSAHVYSACYSLLDWEEGIYAFDPSTVEPPFTVSLQPGELILEAVRSILDIGRIRAFLGRSDQTCLARTDWKIPDQITLRHDEIAVLEKLQESQTVSQVIGALDLPEEQVLRTLCGLLALGALCRVDTTEEALELDLDELGSTGSHAVAPPPPTPAAASPEPPAAPSAPAIDVAQMALFCYEVDSMLNRVNRPGIDYYGILEVSRQASTDEINFAYNQLKEKFDPSSHQDAINQMPVLGPQIQTINTRVEEAYRTLSDTNNRLKYTQDLRQSGKLSGPGPIIPVPPVPMPKPPAPPPQPQPSRPVPAAKPPAQPVKTQPVVEKKLQAEAAEQPSPKVPSPPGPRALNDPSRIRNPDDWYLFGLELMDRGDSVRAARAFQNALKRRPDDAEFHAALARAYAEDQGYNRQSILEFEEAIALKPDSADYQAEIGVFYLKHNHLEEAKRHIDSALAIDSKNRMANKAKLRIEEKKRVEEKKSIEEKKN
jgi:serine/threonine protein kinase/tetratricopeptide (TPR) repeat protein